MHDAAPTPGQPPLSEASYPTREHAAYAAASSYPVCHSSSGISPTTAADLRRELSIQQRGRDIERHQAEVAAINRREPHTFTDICEAGIARGKADMARRDMERLIAGRSPEQRARMQAAQNERMAAEPGATR